ncbi:DUF485 domain-containing protein [Streptomyces albiaxialis]|uniref:DUF485 domain-containing protein n=1 Tax=Streptomyces albiaxialis TaxID=329523 RepID=A0ABP5I1N5_9ACTN
MRIEDPWYDALASGREAPPARLPESRNGQSPVNPAATAATAVPADSTAPVDPAAQDAVYLTVQRSAAFQQVRRRYRRFALPATAAFLVWYLAYVTAATCAPGLMARPVAGVLNVAMAAGLAQFATTFLLTWAYARHARLRRDRLALELRWETQDMARTAAHGEPVA